MLEEEVGSGVWAITLFPNNNFESFLMVDTFSFIVSDPIAVYPPQHKQ